MAGISQGGYKDKKPVKFNFGKISNIETNMLKLKMQNTDAGKIRIILIGADAVINMQIQNQNRHIKTQK